jgi:hypothetical protein
MRDLHAFCAIISGNQIVRTRLLSYDLLESVRAKLGSKGLYHQIAFIFI